MIDVQAAKAGQLFARDLNRKRKPATKTELPKEIKELMQRPDNMTINLSRNDVKDLLEYRFHEEPTLEQIEKVCRWLKELFAEQAFEEIKYLHENGETIEEALTELAK